MRHVTPRNFHEKIDGFLNGKTTAFIHFLAPQPPEGYQYCGAFNGKEMFSDGKGAYFFAKSIYTAGEVSYIREAFTAEQDENGTTSYLYMGDANASHEIKWSPPPYMPVEAARIFLEITRTEIIRFDDLTAEAARATGATGRKPVQQARDTWDSELKRSQAHMRTENNPWVQIVYFRTIPRPERPVSVYKEDKVADYGSRIYTIRLAATGEIVAHGTAKACLQPFGYSIRASFYSLVKSIKEGKTKYTVEIKEPD